MKSATALLLLSLPPSLPPSLPLLDYNAGFTSALAGLRHLALVNMPCMCRGWGRRSGPWCERLLVALLASPPPFSALHPHFFHGQLMHPHITNTHTHSITSDKLRRPCKGGASWRRTHSPRRSPGRKGPMARAVAAAWCARWTRPCLWSGYAASTTVGTARRLRCGT